MASILTGWTLATAGLICMHPSAPLLAPSAAHRPDAGLPATPSGSVLCVDDNPLNTLVLQEYFRLRGFGTIRTAASIAEAMALAHEDPPRAILLDLNLADGSGLDLLAKLRADPATRQVPVAIVSGSTDEADLRAALALGARAWWPKPLDLSILDDQLDSLF